MRTSTLSIATACLALIGGSVTARAGAGATPAAAGSGTQTLGPADPASIVHLQVALRLRNKAELEARTAGGAHLRWDTLAERYLPTPAAQDRVLAWARAHGLTVEATSDSRLTISLSGKAEDAGRGFGVRFMRVHADGKDWVAAGSAAAIPAALADTILGVNGLQPQLHAVPLHVFVAAAPTKPPFYPANFITAYGAGTQGRQGAGTTTAIVIDTFPHKSDLVSFWNTTGVAQSLANIAFIQVNPGTLPALSGEESLDAEQASSVGTAGKVRIYAAQSLAYTALDNDFQRVISDLKGGVAITQVSVSLGACETDPGSAEAQSDDQMFAVIQSLGASIFVSSGDSGTDACGTGADTVSFYASSPNVTAVGGTSLYLSAAGARKSESGWSGSGGGVSGLFTQPAYQSKLTQYNRRALPDISADANPYTGAYIVAGGQTGEVGGTSLSAPLCAGLFGLVNAARLAEGKATLGALNPRIYPLLGKGDFFDIKTGSNGGYTAKAGYDLVTGIGTPYLTKLLPALVAVP